MVVRIPAGLSTRHNTGRVCRYRLLSLHALQVLHAWTLQEKDVLVEEKADLEKERDTLKTDGDTLKTERDALKTEGDDLKTERDRLLKMREHTPWPCAVWLCSFCMFCFSRI